MDIRFQNQESEGWQGQLLLVPTFEGDDPLKICPELEKACSWLAKAPERQDFKAKPKEMTICYAEPNQDIQRVLLCGLGKRDAFTLSLLREVIGRALEKARSLGIKSLILPEPLLAKIPGSRERLLQESVYAALISLYRFSELKTISTELPEDPEWLTIAFSADSPVEAAQAAAKRGEMDAWAVKQARDLDNMPGNHLYPELLALKAAQLAHDYAFKCTILSEEALHEANMGCLLAVGSGSIHPPRLIVLEYAPAEHEQEKPLVFIGKGITFDSGGLCLKPPTNMDQMKSDMSGAGAVLACIAALAREKAARRIVGILACAENMPSGSAYRPGDVLSSAKGISVEVINTDAEGRLALCDALAYAQKNWTAAAIVDIATLTGACAIALGKELAGLFSEDTNFAEHISAIGALHGENYWRLPLWEPYAEDLKSEVADICHSAGREGGAITSALFLKSFVDSGQLWAHLDIAGVDWMSKNSPLCRKGATGFGTRTLLALGRGGIA